MHDISLPTMDSGKSQKKVKFFLRFRWIGAPMLVSGVLLFLSVLSSLPQTHDYFLVLLGFGCSALGLTTFGVSHDTAMAFMVEHHPNTQNFDPVAQRELHEDLNWDQARTLKLTPNPKTAIFVPFLALLLQSYVFFRLSCQFRPDLSSICQWPIF